ncbi:MAG TPA: ATP-binding protein, partial [Bacillota bacterium]|nr:ATP-binding protein [Bacillota bacterium]
ELKGYEQAVVRIRGTLFAVWNADTREVQFGSLLMRHASVSVETPPPADPFDVPTKSARDLLLFDAQATAFRPVKVRAQVLYADAQGVFAADEGLGLRVLTVDAAKLQPGDLIEAVGYPEISGPSPLLRQALVRKTGTAMLPRPRALAGPDLVRKGLDSTLVRVEGKLLGMHSEQHAPVLEIQSNGQLFVARLKPGAEGELSLRPGSQLQLSGVYAQTGRNRRLAIQGEAFELLLNSPADILVLSQPSWWTLERLAVVVGFLVVVLVLAAAWITQLRRQVEQRTAQLQREMRERERAEHHQALEAERSRIARDLHDDLGSSLTEIGVLASTGQRANAEVGGSPALFDAIVSKARGSIAALDVIVWAVDPEDNSLQSLADYLSGFAGEYLSHSNVACRFKIPVTFPPVMLEGRVRHDLFLAVKETLNNVVCHANASEVEFGIAVAESALEIVIADNGKGFDASVPSEGNGLKNLRGRLAKLGGRCVVESHPGGGTNMSIRLPLPVLETGRDIVG